MNNLYKFGRCTKIGQYSFKHITPVEHGNYFKTFYLNSSPLTYCIHFKRNFQKSIKTVKQQNLQKFDIKKEAKEVSTDIFYLFIILCGIGCFGYIGYTLFSEIGSSQSPVSIYGKVFKLCNKNDEVYITFGSPLKSYGSETRRFRRQHIRSKTYKNGDTTTVELQFNIKGPYAEGIVYVIASNKNCKKISPDTIIVQCTFPTDKIITVLQK
ncbi:Mitochondrial import inner membrane translocase subunit Tim21 [Intoshia linei]|uniref:Mitochondrial import inner membrane translocase subunit Tim21 n=1 Tax=Intoshia linei TaxID=1819745 RepID=A0A177ATC9_9BILA|nr:Mitochondrial import inner membrane translocase subunit Tim21 [Intoshia linei]